jgi:hypothetical protein
MLTKGMVRSEFDPKKHYTVDEAAEKVGFARGYFLGQVSPAYKVTKYTNGASVFFEKADVNALSEKIQNRLSENGNHRRGKLPKGKRRIFKAKKSVRRANPTPVAQNGTVDVETDFDMLKKLLRSGVKVRLLLK